MKRLFAEYCKSIREFAVEKGLAFKYWDTKEAAIVTIGFNTWLSRRLSRDRVNKFQVRKWLEKREGFLLPLAKVKVKKSTAE